MVHGADAWRGIAGRTDWTAFVYGSIAGIIPWIVIVMSFLMEKNPFRIRAASVRARRSGPFNSANARRLHGHRAATPRRFDDANVTI